MKNLFLLKKHHLALFALVLTISYGSFSYAKSNLATNWHLVSTQAASPDNDVIGPITMDPSQGGNCATPTNPVRCAIQFSNDLDTDLTNKTAAEAKALPGVTETSRTYSLP